LPDTRIKRKGLSSGDVLRELDSGLGVEVSRIQLIVSRGVDTEHASVFVRDVEGSNDATLQVVVGHSEVTIDSWGRRRIAVLIDGNRSLGVSVLSQCLGLEYHVAISPSPSSGELIVRLTELHSDEAWLLWVNMLKGQVAANLAEFCVRIHLNTRGHRYSGSRGGDYKQGCKWRTRDKVWSVKGIQRLGVARTRTHCYQLDVGECDHCLCFGEEED
jgi:hypothetical protein